VDLIFFYLLNEIMNYSLGWVKILATLHVFTIWIKFALLLPRTLQLLTQICTHHCRFSFSSTINHCALLHSLSLSTNCNFGFNSGDIRSWQSLSLLLFAWGLLPFLFLFFFCLFSQFLGACSNKLINFIFFFIFLILFGSFSSLQLLRPTLPLNNLASNDIDDIRILNSSRDVVLELIRISLPIKICIKQYFKVPK